MLERVLTIKNLDTKKILRTKIDALAKRNTVRFFTTLFLVLLLTIIGTFFITIFAKDKVILNETLLAWERELGRQHRADEILKKGGKTHTNKIKELNEIARITLNNHESRLSEHDQRLNESGARLSEHDRQINDTTENFKKLINNVQDFSVVETDKIQKALDEACKEFKARKSIVEQFQQISAEHKGSVVLVYASTDIVNSKGFVVDNIDSYGSGFILKDGWVVTCKHVIQPWKFYDSTRIAMKISGYHAKLKKIAIWTDGSRALKEKKKPDLSVGYNTELGNLKLVLTSPDEWEHKTTSFPFAKYDVHVIETNSDIAILKISGKIDNYLKLSSDPHPQKLDPIMVMGFPVGTFCLETQIAELSPALGTIRKIETTIAVTAPIIGGNSGGPLINLDGEVIGIAVRTIGPSGNMGLCLKASHIWNYLKQAKTAYK